MNKSEINIPASIIVAGLIVAAGIYASSAHPVGTPAQSKSIAAQAGLNEKKIQACASTDKYNEKITNQSEGGDRAMQIIPPDRRGTPFNVIVDTKTGVKAQLAGAYPHDSFKQIIDGMLAGTEKGEAIDLVPITAEDHFYGNKDAEIVIIEYGDLECPYCAAVHPTIHQLLKEYDGKVAWVFRHFPLSIHKDAHIKAVAAECAYEDGGDTAFFKYLDATYDAINEKINPKFDTSTL